MGIGHFLVYIFTLTFLFVTLTNCKLAAQSKTGRFVEAKVIQSESMQPLGDVIVSIFDIQDSTILKTTMTNKAGYFKIEIAKSGKYKLVLSHLGLKSFTQTFELSRDNNLTFNLGTILLFPEIIKLDEVFIKDQIPITIKKDTVEFKTSFYKTQLNDNVEQLLRKLPGFDVDKDGKIIVQGQRLRKIYVDGKDFFGNDPKAATKNLPADAIDKVQLIDDKTEKTKSTGIDDGQREKVLNLTLKENKKKGWFGNASSAGGTNNRFLGQFNINHFDNQKQFSALFLSNNVNESGFTMEDLNNFSGGNPFDVFGSSDGSNTINVDRSGRANINGAFSGVSGGLITNHSGGLNYSDLFGTKNQLKLNISLVTITSSNNILQEDVIENPVQNLLTTQYNNGSHRYDSYRLNINLDYKVDSLTNIRFKPTINYGYRTGQNAIKYNTTNYVNSPKNSGDQLLDQTIQTPLYGGQFSVNKKLSNGRGSFNLFANGSYSPYHNRNTTNFSATTYPNNVPTDSLSALYTNQIDYASNLNGTLSFVRQLSKRQKLNISVSQNLQYRYDNANQNTLAYNALTGFYDIISAQHSGEYNNTSWRYGTTVGLNQTKEKITINLNAELANTGLNGEFIFPVSAPVKRNEWAFVPNFSVSYRPKSGSSMYVSVKSDIALPLIIDLQPFVNTSNTIYKRIGNPNLTLSRSLNINGSYNTFDFKNNYFFNFYGSFIQLWNGFSTESFFDNSGITTSRAINTDGNYSTNIGFNIGKPTKIKGLKINLGINGSVNRNINLINNNKNIVLRISPNLNIGTNYDTDKIQLVLNGSVSYNNASNSYQQVANQRYYTFNNYFSASIKLAKTWRIYSDLTQSLFKGLPASSNTSVYLLNPGVEHYFLKDQNLILTLSGFDLLRQNAGLQRSISTTGQTTMSRTNILGQYFYLKINYKIRRITTLNR